MCYIICTHMYTERDLCIHIYIYIYSIATLHQHIICNIHCVWPDAISLSLSLSLSLSASMSMFYLYLNI